MVTFTRMGTRPYKGVTRMVIESVRLVKDGLAYSIQIPGTTYGDNHPIKGFDKLAGIIPPEWYLEGGRLGTTVKTTGGFDSAIACAKECMIQYHEITDMSSGLSDEHIACISEALNQKIEEGDIFFADLSERDIASSLRSAGFCESNPIHPSGMNDEGIFQKGRTNLRYLLR